MMTNIILGVEAVMAIGYFICLRRGNKLYETIPHTIQQIGLLGTFIGLSEGLRNFSRANLEDSIMTILIGLSTALTTSIVAIGIAIVLNAINKHIQNVEDDDIKLLQAKSLAEIELLIQEGKAALAEINTQIGLKELEYDQAQLKNEGLLKILENSEQTKLEARVKCNAAEYKLKSIDQTIEKKLKSSEELDTIIAMKNAELAEAREKLEENKEENKKEWEKARILRNAKKPKKKKGLFGWLS